MNDRMKAKKYLLVLLILTFSIFLVACGSDLADEVSGNTDWVGEEAEIEIKSVVYSDYGEIPALESEILYENEPDYIVIVRFHLKELDWSGSYACHIYGYEDNCYLHGSTDEMSYDYDYQNSLEELKTIFKIG